MKTAQEILNAKGRQVWAIAPGATVFEALRRMADVDVGALLVLEEGRIVGILSERDYARRIILRDKRSKETRVHEIMSREVFCVSPRASIEECMTIMTQKRCRHLPVVENDRVAGMVSIGDVVKAVIADQELRIEQLQNYIGGNYR